MHVASSESGPATCRRVAPGAGAGLGWPGLLALLILLPGGCDSTRHSLDPILLTRQQTLEIAQRAHQDPQADERRLAVNRLVRSPFLGDEEVLEILATVARGDRSVPVRVAAVSALAHADTPVSCAYCAALLPRSDVPLDRFPPETVRGEALAGLERCAANGRLSEKLADHAAEVGVRLLQMDFSRQGRLAAARLLGHFPRRAVLDALIAALEQRDFAVCHAAELSLQHLTGRSFDHDPNAWRDYVASASDPFAKPATASGSTGGAGSWFDWLSPEK